MAKRRRTPAKRSSGGLAKKGLGMKVGAAAIGAVAAQAMPGLGNQISEDIPITYGAIVGLAMIYKGKTDLVRYAGFGALLGGGLVQLLESYIGPQLADLGARPAGA